MCGIFYSRVIVPKVLDDLDRRGPDGSKQLKNNLGFFYHSLLETQSNNVQQPMINNHGTLLYNGTQYNLGIDDNNYIVQGLDNNVNRCVEFIQSLSGDFALIWVTNNFVLLARDFGGNKPLYYGLKEDLFCAASSEQQVIDAGLEPIELDANTIIVFEHDLVRRWPAYVFDLNQTVNNFDRVFECFEVAVLERYREPAVVPLSSGIDSGMLVACLNQDNKDFLISVRVGHEDHAVLEQRLSELQQPRFVFNDVDISTIREVSKLKYSKISANPQVAQVAWHTAAHASKLGYRYVLTGTGADEVYSDYGWQGKKYASYSLFGGCYPHDLSKIWPWMLRPTTPMHSSILIDDHIYGMHGMDTRCPFLDVNLIQAWLNVVPELKNKEYKHWQQQYLRIKNFSYTKEKKVLPITPSLRSQLLISNQQSGIVQKLTYTKPSCLSTVSATALRSI